MSDMDVDPPGAAGVSACPRRASHARARSIKPPVVNSEQMARHKIQDTQFDEWHAQFFRDASPPEQYDAARRRVMELRTKAKMMREARRLEHDAQREIDRPETDARMLPATPGGTPSGNANRVWWTKQGKQGVQAWRTRRECNGVSASLTVAQRMRKTGPENFTAVDVRVPVPVELRPEMLPGLLLVPNRQSMKDFAALWRLLHVIFYTLRCKNTHRFAMDFARMMLPEAISSRACAGTHASRVEVVFAVAYALVEFEALPNDATKERSDGVQALSLKCAGSFLNRMMLRDRACAFRNLMTVFQFLFGPIGTAHCIEGFKRRSAPTQGLRLFESNEARAVFGIGTEVANMMSMHALWQRWRNHVEHELRSQQLDEVEVRSMVRGVSNWGLT